MTQVIIDEVELLTLRQDLAAFERKIDNIEKTVESNNSETADLITAVTDLCTNLDSVIEKLTPALTVLSRLEKLVSRIELIDEPETLPSSVLAGEWDARKRLDGTWIKRADWKPEYEEELQNALDNDVIQTALKESNTSISSNVIDINSNVRSSDIRELEPPDIFGAKPSDGDHGPDSFPGDEYASDPVI